VVCRWAGSRGWGRDELGQEFAGGGVDDADVEVVDREEDLGSGVGSADADVVESSVVAEGETAPGLMEMMCPGLQGVELM